MGAWGVGPFSNDDAADFVDDVADLDPSDVQDALMQALQLASDDYVELPDGCTAIAAAALIAMKGGYTPPENDEPAANVGFEVTQQLRNAATAALRRVRGARSEWTEVWDDAGTVPEATRVLADIDQHLS